MKKLSIFVAVVIALLLNISAAAGQPAQAQEDLDTILARAAAKSFLVTLTRPELSNLMSFYTQDSLNVEAVVAQAGDVTGYAITRAEWLQPGQTYQVEAALQPGNRQIIIQTGQHNNRWLVKDVQLTGAATPVAGVATNTGANQPRRVEGNGFGKLVFQTQSGGDIYIINADGSGLQRVTHGIDPQLSPDGTKIAFTRWEPEFTLFTINIDGTNETAWFGAKTQMKSPTWSADGSRLVFSHRTFFDPGGPEKINPQKIIERALRRGETLTIPEIPANARSIEIENGIIRYVIPPDAHWTLGQVDMVKNEYRDLATGSQYNYAPSWHPTDPNLLLWRGDKGIGMYNAQTQSGQPISFDDRDRGAIAISPDGSKIAFSYWQDGHWEIHTMNIDGSNRQRLTETPLHIIAQNSRSDMFVNEEGYQTLTRAQSDQMPNPNWNNTAPAWSPDGSQIAFMSDRSGKWEIWIMNSDGSNQRPMFPNGALAGLTFDYAGVDERMISWR